MASNPSTLGTDWCWLCSTRKLWERHDEAPWLLQHHSRTVSQRQQFKKPLLKYEPSWHINIANIIWNTSGSTEKASVCGRSFKVKSNDGRTPRSLALLNRVSTALPLGLGSQSLSWTGCTKQASWISLFGSSNCTGLALIRLWSRHI